MYSGLTLTKLSGRLLGAHQKIDRVARDDLAELLRDNADFPSSRDIVRFEGLNGPDGIKRKSPAKDEPWHYIDPFDEQDTSIFGIIEGHYAELVKALRERNKARSSFEAAWLAHALVDGLTPAHHYPFAEKLQELRGGEGLETRTTIRKKLIMPGITVGEKVKNNWRMWGPRGLYMTHIAFELGVASIIAPMRFKRVKPSLDELSMLHELGLREWYKRRVKSVARLGIYDIFDRRGWNRELAHMIRTELAPNIVKTVTLVWLSAVRDAEVGIKE